jgi:selenoprotein W-related protein
LTDTLLATLGPRVSAWTLVPSRGGVFEVWVDDHLIFSKRQTGRHPTPEEILATIQAQP